MKLRYQCLVLDHDDTVMDSTTHVHWPAFLAAMEQMRPGVWLSLDDYFRVNFDPGFVPYCRDVLHFTEADFAREVEIWQRYVDAYIPKVFPAMARIIRQQKALGGYVCVASHSLKKNIFRDYQANELPMPDMVYGWDLLPEQRKPAPYSLMNIMQTFQLAPQELLMVDDLKPGYEMAKACNVDFAAAGWAYDIPEISAFMQQNCDLYFRTPEALEQFLFDS